eukprot:6473835-Prymnesium_polylepis.1
MTDSTAIRASANASGMLRPFASASKNAAESTRAAPSCAKVRQQTTVGTPAARTAKPSASLSHPLRNASSRAPPCFGDARPSISAMPCGLMASSPPLGPVKPSVT